MAPFSATFMACGPTQTCTVMAQCPMLPMLPPLRATGGGFSIIAGQGAKFRVLQNQPLNMPTQDLWMVKITNDEPLVGGIPIDFKAWIVCVKVQ
jgi:hypothetical protein